MLRIQSYTNKNVEKINFYLLKYTIIISYGLQTIQVGGIIDKFLNIIHSIYVIL